MRTELYWIEGPWPGKLAIMPRPRGGDWLEDEVVSWRRAGVDVVVSALTGEEITELDLAREAQWCAANGVEFVAFPITDRGVPEERKAAAELIRRLEGLLRAGQRVAIHCRQGVGRAAVLAACLLASAGVGPDVGFARIEAARGRPVPDTPEQRAWVVRFAHEFFPALQGETSGR
jgi:protein-tyrosine phosphatase